MWMPDLSAVENVDVDVRVVKNMNVRLVVGIVENLDVRLDVRVVGFVQKCRCGC